MSLFLNTSNTSDRKKLFTSFGSIRVRVLEAADCLDAITSTDKELIRNKSSGILSFNVYARIVIANENGEPLYHFSTATFSYSSGTLDICAEEYVFEGISSSYNVIASLYAANTYFENKCIGLVVIPISRLEENTLVS